MVIIIWRKLLPVKSFMQSEILEFENRFPSLLVVTLSAIDNSLSNQKAGFVIVRQWVYTNYVKKTTTLFHIVFQQNHIALSLIIMQIIPVQVVPSPVNPQLHVQIYEPLLFLHVAFVSQGLEIHSSMTEILKKMFVNVIRLYLRGFLSHRDQGNQNIIINFILYSSKTRRTVEF